MKYIEYLARGRIKPRSKVCNIHRSALSDLCITLSEKLPPLHPCPPSPGYVMKDFKEYLGVSERCKRKEPFLIELFAGSEYATQGKHSIVGEVS